MLRCEGYAMQHDRPVLTCFSQVVRHPEGGRAGERCSTSPCPSKAWKDSDPNDAACDGGSCEIVQRSMLGELITARYAV